MITIEYNGTLIEIPNNMYRAFEDEQGEALDFLGDDDSPDIVLNDEQFQKMVELAKRSKIASYIISELTKSGAEYENAPYRKWETGAAYDPDEPEPDELTGASGEFEESEHPKTGTLETGITDLLYAVGLKKRFCDLIFNQATARGMQAREATDFTFFQLDTLKAYVNENKKASNTVEELKALIIEWLTDQDKEILKNCV